MHFKSIAVEGPIGVGKTSLVDFLAERLEARKVLEPTDNPFLNDFYQDKSGAAFQCQLFFLVNRFRQQQEMVQGNLFKQATVCDYIFAKDKVFAYLNLSDSELMLYEKIYGVLEEQVPHPDLVIYLQARNEVLMQRIRSRERDYEREISERYVWSSTRRTSTSSRAGRTWRRFSARSSRCSGACSTTSHSDPRDRDGSRRRTAGPRHRSQERLSPSTVKRGRDAASRRRGEEAR